MRKNVKLNTDRWRTAIGVAVSWPLISLDVNGVVVAKWIGERRTRTNGIIMTTFSPANAAAGK